MLSLRDRVFAAFTSTFGAAPHCIVAAPGRVNLIGEHTDYNDGFVLPCAIDFQVLVAISPRDDGVINVVATDYANALDTFAAHIPIAKHPDAAWANYVRGVTQVLGERGIVLAGANMAVGGDVPQGAGLSSSAALEVAVLTAFNHLYTLGLSRTDIALLAQRAENTFVGCQCGIMDQLIAAHGSANHALLIDCRSLAATPIPLPNDIAVMIVHSGVVRGLVESAYNERRAQCEAAARHYGVAALRDLDSATLLANAGSLDKTTLARARHVVTENQRTLDAAHALANNDLATLARLMAASHHAMRDDFEVSVPAIDHLVEIIATTLDGRGGARMTGGGFGGCVVAVMPRAEIESVRAAIAAQYRAPNGLAAQVWICQASAGVRVVS